MNILLTNDDGILAEGLQVLRQTLLRRGHQVEVAAPDRERSAASQSLTITRPLRVRTLEPGVHSIDGTPADCVHLGVLNLVTVRPDLVISGINWGLGSPPAVVSGFGFISFDIDVMDPAYTPGTGTPEPNGLTPRETFPLIRRLCAESNVVGFELTELLPYRVSGYETVLNSERIVRECLVGITLRKKGIDVKHYLSPHTVDDGRK